MRVMQEICYRRKYHSLKIITEDLIKLYQSMFQHNKSIQRVCAVNQGNDAGYTSRVAHWIPRPSSRLCGVWRTSGYQSGTQAKAPSGLSPNCQLSDLIGTILKPYQHEDFWPK
jgi:hypothetical protein